jgi:hypothetical protein
MIGTKSGRSGLSEGREQGLMAIFNLLFSHQ